MILLSIHLFIAPPRPPVLLLGLKTDLRFHAAAVDGLHAAGQTPVAKTTALQFARDLGPGCVGYRECYALAGEGDSRLASVVECCISAAGKAGSKRKKEGGRRCLVS